MVAVETVTTNPHIRPNSEMIVLLVSTLLLRVGFGASLILFDWTLVWGIEHAFGIERTAGLEAILLTSFAGITYLIAEIMFTGYYGNRSDIIGAKPVVWLATIGGGVALIFYAPASLIFNFSLGLGAFFAIILLTLYLATIHFVHGVFASAKVAPTLGFINHLSDENNRAKNMSYFDNAILYGRVLGMITGGGLWIIFGVDAFGLSTQEQSIRIALATPILGLILFVAALLIKFGLSNPPTVIKETKKFSLKDDISLAYSVMMQDSRRPLLLPWLSIAALIGSASLWGPSVAFRIASSSENAGSERGITALVPIMFILFSLALPAPIWGILADKLGNEKILKVGLFGTPVAFVGGLLVGFPFYYPGIANGDPILSNIPLLLAIAPTLFMFSAFVPVLLGSLGDTAEKGKKDDGHVMSGYHFIIATGEIIGILIGGIFIGVFAILPTLFPGLPGDQGTYILLGFLLFELILIIGIVVGVLKVPSKDKFIRKTSSEAVV